MRFILQLVHNFGGNAAVLCNFPPMSESRRHPSQRYPWVLQFSTILFSCPAISRHQPSILDWMEFPVSNIPTGVVFNIIDRAGQPAPLPKKKEKKRGVGDAGQPGRAGALETQPSSFLP